MLKVTVRGATKLQRDLKAESQRQKKALETAIRVEGFRLRKQLIKEIKAGAPGGRRFKSLRAITRREGSRFLPDRRFANKHIQIQTGANRWRSFSMADIVRYHVTRYPDFQMAVGWTGPQVSRSWKRIARKQQEGFTAPVGGFERGMFARMGGNLGKRSRLRKYFFLRKSTRTFRTPAQPIMEPFWADEKARAMKNIRNNFRLKLQGKRI